MYRTPSWPVILVTAVTRDMNHQWASRLKELSHEGNYPCNPALPFKDCAFTRDEILIENPSRARELNKALALGQVTRFVDAPCVNRRFKSTARSLISAAAEAYRDGRPTDIACELTAMFVRGVRQILGLYGRLTSSKAGMSPQLCNEAITGFKARLTNPGPDIDRSGFWLILPEVGRAIFSDVDFDVVADQPLLPFRHGPGAVAEKCDRRCKDAIFYGQMKEDQEKVFDLRILRKPMESDPWFEYRNRIWTNNTSYSRMCCVPKDYRGPRVIAAEPTLTVYLAEGVDHLLRQNLLQIGVDLSRQEDNQHLAMLGSTYGGPQDPCTLDLKDASDTVYLSVVRVLLSRCPKLLSVVEALRSSHVSVKGELIESNLFATMGHPLTFAMETSVILSSILAEYLLTKQSSRNTVTRKTILAAMHELGLHCYGDDTVVRRKYAPLATNALRRVGMIPNTAKCCIGGAFRESCGTDYLYGWRCEPLRPRLLPGADYLSIPGLVAQIQNFSDRDMWDTASAIALMCELSGMRVPIFPPIGNGQHIAGCVDNLGLYLMCTRYAETRSGGRPYDYQRQSEVRIPASRLEEPQSSKQQGLLARYWRSLYPHESSEDTDPIIREPLRGALKYRWASIPPHVDSPPKYLNWDLALDDDERDAILHAPGLPLRKVGPRAAKATQSKEKKHEK